MEPLCLFGTNSLEGKTTSAPTVQAQIRDKLGAGRDVFGLLLTLGQCGNATGH